MEKRRVGSGDDDDKGEQITTDLEDTYKYWKALLRAVISKLDSKTTIESSILLGCLTLVTRGNRSTFV